MFKLRTLKDKGIVDVEMLSLQKINYKIVNLYGCNLPSILMSVKVNNIQYNKQQNNCQTNNTASQKIKYLQHVDDNSQFNTYVQLPQRTTSGIYYLIWLGLHRSLDTPLKFEQTGEY